MAKKFYDVDHQGKVLVERRSGDPSAEQGRLYVETGSSKLKACPDGANNRVVVVEDGGNYGINVTGVATTAKYA